jgi:small subunit ribosomal protein S1
MKKNYDSPIGFDWDLYEHSNHVHLRENQSIAKTRGDSKSKVFSRAKYAQELYDAYSGVTTQITETKEGSVVQGKVVSINSHFAIVDIGWREDAMIDLRKEDPEFVRYIQPGFPVEVIIEKIGNYRGSSSKNIIASYSKNILAKKKEELFESIGEPVAYLGKVTELIHGGYFVDISGVQCFMPGSLGGMNKLVNFEDLIGKSFYVMVINYSKEKDYLVVSHREYLKTLVPEEISKLQMGVQYEGFITGTSKHGVFVEFNGCLTGLISRADILPEKLDDFDNRRVKAGSSINFYVKEIIDNDKIVLSEKPIVIEPSAWDDIEERYKVPSQVTGKIKKIVQYGAFIELEPKIVGLLHKSHLNEDFELEVGQEIEVKITRIDKESKKVDFTI